MTRDEAIAKLERICVKHELKLAPEILQAEADWVEALGLIKFEEPVRAVRAQWSRERLIAEFRDGLAGEDPVIGATRSQVESVIHYLEQMEKGG
jgi:hypothetical protein